MSTVVKDILDSTSDTIDNIEAQLDILEGGVKVVKSTKLVVGTLVVGAGILGAVGTYFIVKKRLEKKFEERLENELESARAFYIQRNKTGEYSDPEALAESMGLTSQNEEHTQDLTTVAALTRSYQSDDIAKAAERAANGETAPEEPVVAEEVVNIFTQSEQEFDYEAEIKNRSIEAPYIITRQEFDAGEAEYQQISLTYYEGDDVLADDKEVPINDSDPVVGDNNLDRFGHGSGDQNMLYIRNERMEIDIEVARSDGSYANQVLGLQHSDRQPPRKFRSRDE